MPASGNDQPEGDRPRRLSRWRGAALIVAATVAVGLSFSPGAAAYIYWANSTNYRVGRATNDGTVQTQQLFLGFNGEIAVDGSYIYYGNPFGAIGRGTSTGRT